MRRSSGSYYCCGLRISEARKLRWQDVDLKQGFIRIFESKGHKDRRIYLAKDLARLFTVYEKVLYDKYDCFFSCMCYTVFIGSQYFIKSDRED